MKQKIANIFRTKLLEWARNHPRPLPWKEEQDPYAIYLSEIILQQTRVEQGIPYYYRFKESFPTIYDLAKAPEDRVMHLWQGLGYYSRARNLHATAKKIVDEYKGIFPSNYQDLIQLKGVGPYTAAAILSFAFNLPYAVLDGNVFRVLSRVFSIEHTIDSSEGKHHFKKLADQLLDQESPGDYNQALMNLGALICKPSSPNCSECPFEEICQAKAFDVINSYPRKKKKKKRKERILHYVALFSDDFIWIHKRQKQDIWKGLYDLPEIITQKRRMTLDQIKMYCENEWKLEVEEAKRSSAIKQNLTHQQITFYFYQVKVNALPAKNVFGYNRVKLKNLSKFAFPKTIDCYLKDNYINLYI